MTHISDIVDSGLLTDMLDQKYVKVQTHPKYGYSIYNYTDRATFDRVWNAATINCRGLITDARGTVIARGMPKFFNHNQVEAPKFGLDDPVFVADKADGSLGILYPTPEGGWAVATRGSFTSDQAIHATENLPPLVRYRPATFDEETRVFEIVYPGNRIVVDYGDRDELVPLGVVNNATGRFYPKDPEFGIKTYAEALALPPRENAEGLVLTRVSDGAMLKIKQEDYLALHRVIFGLNARKLWQLIVDGEDVDNYIAALPDEFQDWARGEVWIMEQDVQFLLGNIEAKYHHVVDELNHEYGDNAWTRGDFAQKVRDYEFKSYLFLLLDGKDIEPVVWRNNKPGPNISPVQPRTEDEA